jgi:hypothetical protein
MSRPSLNTAKLIGSLGWGAEGRLNLGTDATRIHLGRTEVGQVGFKGGGRYHREPAQSKVVV